MVVVLNQFTKGGVVKTNTIFLIGMALIVSACTPKYSEVPTAKNFENTEQHVLQAAKHWDLINNEVSKQLVERLAGKVGKDEVIFISDPHSIYSKNLYQDVVSSLVVAGYTVLKPEPDKSKSKSLRVPPAHQVLIELNPTIIKFSHGRKQPHDVGYPSAIATGLWTLKGLGATAYGGATAGIYAYDVYDWFSSHQFSGGTPQTEVVIDVTVSRQNRYVAIIKDIYYIVDSDTSLYQALENEEPLIHQYQVVGAGK
ncbi:hypothetical protein [Methylophilus sp. TWE2]|uniref:hypothetical protein n=1 Tax=Methylophilus sp. TWE2 TaxID=1662285 RepID=UPI0006718204|nr:hypothetical protein [Methylophilus sp. TWE2]AKR42905.1 hypothetical protein ACJ67_05345 [Methylophilus sp. TWE2]